MASTPQTSASYSATSPAISSAYQRISGATPEFQRIGGATTIISSAKNSGAGPKLKSIKDSLMEREKAKREVEEELNPYNKLVRLQFEESIDRIMNPSKYSIPNYEGKMATAKQKQSIAMDPNKSKSLSPKEKEEYLNAPNMLSSYQLNNTRALLGVPNFVNR